MVHRSKAQAHNTHRLTLSFWNVLTNVPSLSFVCSFIRSFIYPLKETFEFLLYAKPYAEYWEYRHK